MEEKIKQRLEEINRLRQIAQIQIDALNLEWDALCQLRDKEREKKEHPQHQELVFTLEK